MNKGCYNVDLMMMTMTMTLLASADPRPGSVNGMCECVWPHIGQYEWCVRVATMGSRVVCVVWAGDRTVLFDVDGHRLFVGTHNVLKVFSCPSATCLDSISVSWGSVVDMARTDTYLVR